MQLVPLKVVIGLRPNGHADHPNFNELPSSVRGNTDWSQFVDRFGGWHYDKVSGHQQADAVSPLGVQHGVLLVPEDFAAAAVDAFPQCEVLDEGECEAFYNTRAHAHEPAVHDQAEVLQAIAAKRAAGIPVDADDDNAINPDHPAPGRRRNRRKTWQGFLADTGHSVDTAAVARLRRPQ